MSGGPLNNKQIAFLVRGGRVCHTEGIFPSHSTICLREMVCYSGEDALRHDRAYSHLSHMTLAPAWYWPSLKRSVSMAKLSEFD